MPPFDEDLDFKFYAPINDISINILVWKKRKKNADIICCLLLPLSHFLPLKASQKVRISQGGCLGTCNFTEHA